MRPAPTTAPATVAALLRRCGQQNGFLVITIVDYGVGNIGAMLNMFDHLGVEAVASGAATVVARAEKLLLPGVGAFDKAMSTLRSSALVEPLNEAVLERGVPILGVCLGMQLFARRSEEGGESGLSWIDADVRQISVPDGSDFKVPNVGWLDVLPIRDSVLFAPGAPTERFYFDHSYQLACDDRRDVTAVADYGVELICAISRRNICGVQFHPEKSHRFGMRLLKAFAEGS